MDVVSPPSVADSSEVCCLTGGDAFPGTPYASISSSRVLPYTLADDLQHGTPTLRRFSRRLNTASTKITNLVGRIYTALFQILALFGLDLARVV